MMDKIIKSKNIDYESLIIDDLNLDDYYFVMEYCDGNLIDFFNDEHDINIYKSCIFQICSAIYCLQKYVKIYHNDLSITNIMFKKIDENIKKDLETQLEKEKAEKELAQVKQELEEILIDV